MEPTLILVFGLPGAGKSTLAQNLSTALHAEYLSSDRLRRELRQDARYHPEAKKRVYQELRHQAFSRLAQGQAVVLDATFSKAEYRHQFFSLARELQAQLFLIEVWAPENIIAERMQRDRHDSEADLSVYQKIKAQFEPVNQEHLKLATHQENLDLQLHRALHYLSDENRAITTAGSTSTS